MDLLLLGTAAADAWPSAYCDCDMCTEARRRGGPNIRSRSGALLDDDFKIDHGPDTMMQMQRQRRSLGRVKTILYTHDHPDHLYPIELKRASPPNTTTRPPEPIAVYGNDRVLGAIRKTFENPIDWSLDLRPIRPFETIVTEQGDTILPLPATHSPEALLFRITRRGKHILYGHDTGVLKTETIDSLSDGVALDVALFDCTHGIKDSLCEHHLNIPTMLRMIDTLRQRGAITDRTRVIATHFSHGGRLLHEELVATLMPHRVEVAFDGMLIQC